MLQVTLIVNAVSYHTNVIILKLFAIFIQENKSFLLIIVGTQDRVTD